MTDSQDRNPVEVLADDFVERCRKGERPELTEYTDRHPDLADEIRELFPLLVEMEDIRSSDDSATPSSTATAAPPLQQLGDYRIIREVGRGGMGIVYEAEQVSLGRHVALKVLPQEMLDNPKQRSRFEREAKAAAKLHHTNIVPVFGVGEDDGLNYYVMQYIQGLALDEVLTELKRIKSEPGSSSELLLTGELRINRRDASARDVACSLVTGTFHQLAGEEDRNDDGQNQLDATVIQPSGTTAAPALPSSTTTGRLSDTFANSDSSVVLPGRSKERSEKTTKKQTYWHSIAQIGVQVADALHYAHDQSVLHRDIKPANLLLDMQGTVWVTDFGLAKLEDERNLTQTGDVLGTLRYMAPESFKGQADARSEIYSLGLTLYELLAFRPAFDERNRNTLIEQVMNAQVERLGKINREIPSDLQTIVHKAIDRDPEHRYQSAAELGEDLQRYIDDEPIKARRISMYEGFRRWSRRNKGLAASLSTVTLLIVAFAIGSTIAAGYFQNLSQKLEIAQNDAERKADVNAKLADEKQQALGLQKTANQQLQTALENEQAALQEQIRQRDEADRQKTFAQKQLERAEWLLYANQIRLAQMEWNYGDPTIAKEALEHCRMSFRGWEHDYLHTEITRNQRTFQGHSDAIDDVVFSPDGKRVVSGSWDNTLKIWDVETGRTIDTLRGHSGDILSVRFSPDGGRVVSCSRDGTVRIWDVKSDRAPQGLASGFLAGVSKFLGRNESWRLVRTLRGHSAEVYSVCFSPDGGRIASGSADRTLRLWDAETGKNTHTLQAGVYVSSLAFSPDGTRIASGSADYTGTTGDVRIWDAETGENTHILRGHTEAVESVAFSPDGTRIVSASHRNYLRSSGDIRIWNAATGDQIRTLSADTGGVFQVSFSPDGSRILGANGDRTIKVWDANTGRELLTLKGHMRMVFGANFSPDGKQIVSGSWDNTLKVWDVEPRQEASALRGHRQAVRSLAYSDDGKWIASASQDNTVRIWDAASGQQQRVLVGHTGTVYSVDFSPDGQRVVSGGEDKSVRVWDASSGLQIASFMGHRNVVNSVGYSPNGQHIVSGAQDKNVKMWDSNTGELVFTLSGRKGGMRGVHFSPDGKQIACGSNDGSVRVWDASSGSELHELTGHENAILCTGFSPDGEHLVSGSQDKTVKVWKLSTGQAILTLKGHTDAVWDVSFSPDGKRIVSGSYEGKGNPGELKVWDAASGQELLGMNSDGLCLTFSPDGKRILSAGVDGAIKIWDASARQDSHTLKGHNIGIWGVRFSPDGKRIASAGRDDTIKIWDADTGAEKLILEGHSRDVRSVNFSPDGTQLVSSGGDGIKVWDAITGRVRLDIDGHSKIVFSVSYSPDGKWIASGSGDNEIKVWDAETGRETMMLSGHSAAILCVAFSPDGKQIVSSSVDKLIKIWDVDTGQEKQTLKGHESGISCVSFSPDGQRIVSAGDDQTIRIWQTTTGDEILTLIGHSGPVRSVHFSADGNRIVSGSSDKTVKVWNAATGEEILTLANHTEAVHDVQFSPDGLSLVSGSDDATVRMWNPPDLSELAGSSTDGQEQTAATAPFAAPTTSMIYWTDRRIRGICRMNLDGSNAQTILWDLREPRGMLLHNDAELYYCDYELDRIGRTDLTGAAPQLVIPSTPGVRGIAIDDRSKKIYWTDRELKTAYRANLDGTNVEELMSDGLVYPYAIQVDPIADKLFVEDHSAGVIFRSNLDGSEREKLITFPSSIHTGGMVLDAEARMLYYKGDSGRQIMRLGLDDDNKPQMLLRTSNDVLGLAIDKKNGKLYWADTAIRRCNLDGTQMETILETTLGAVKSIVIYHPPPPVANVTPALIPEEVE